MHTLYQAVTPKIIALVQTIFYIRDNSSKKVSTVYSTAGQILML